MLTQHIVTSAMVKGGVHTEQCFDHDIRDIFEFY